MTAPELLPCPFCGGKVSFSTWEAYSTDASYSCVKCPKCLVTMPCDSPRFDYTSRTWSDGTLEAIAAWNRRTTPEALSSSPEVAALITEARREEQAYALALEQELRDRAAATEPPLMSESDFDCLILDAMAEAMKAMRKFPQPNYVISKIAEEAGEVVKAAIHCAEGRETAENLRGEMKQLIAMLYRLWVEGDQVHGLGSVAAAIRALKEEAP